MGTRVNTVSIYGMTASVGSFNYDASQAAVIIVTRPAALELAQHGVRVVARARTRTSAEYMAQVEAASLVAHSQADAAQSIACKPTFNVGSSTGAKRGEWLLGSVCSVPSALA